MAPLGIPMSEDDYYETSKWKPAAAEKGGEQKAEASRQPEKKARQPEEKVQQQSESEVLSAASKSVTDEYRQQMRNAALLQAKQAEILQKQGEQLDYSQKLMERYDALLTRMEEKNAKS